MKDFGSKWQVMGKCMMALVWVATSCICLHAQPQINPGVNKKELIEFFEKGSAIKILKVKYRGARRAIGTFQDQDSIFNMREGLVLSSGSVAKISRDNRNTSTSRANLKRGYKPLSNIAKIHTRDAAVVEITFIPKEEYISFNYVFGSEEYPEFVRSQFNDVFAFYLKRERGGKTNLARIPGNKGRIAINNVNHLRNQWYYVNNSYIWGDPISVDPDTMSFSIGSKTFLEITTYNIEYAIIDTPRWPVEFDGFTKLLQAKSRVVPGEIYKLILCVADAGDFIYDTSVLIEAGSFNSSANEDFMYGALSQNEDYYYTKDTILVHEEPIEEELEKVCNDTFLVYNYASDQYKLGKSHNKAIKEVLNGLDPDFQYRIRIEAFTDEDGSTKYNNNLSRKRAQNIADFIESLQLPYIKVNKVKAGGEDTSVKKGKAEKRRVVVHIQCE